MTRIQQFQLINPTFNGNACYPSQYNAAQCLPLQSGVCSFCNRPESVEPNYCQYRLKLPISLYNDLRSPVHLLLVSTNFVIGLLLCARDISSYLSETMKTGILLTYVIQCLVQNISSGVFLCLERNHEYFHCLNHRQTKDYVSSCSKLLRN